MESEPTIRQTGEDALLEDLLPLLPRNEDLIEGPGDDCAIVRGNRDTDILLKTDCVVEGLHFLPETPPELIGRKALARPLSDIAAMGGLPGHALVTFMVHPSRPASLIRGIYRGLSSLAEEYGVSLAGGESSGLPYDGLALSVALTGTVPSGAAIRRSTARPGDLIAVTGVLGGSFPSLHHLTFRPRIPEGRALRQTGLVTAMMDLSDGLGTDLPRLAASSGLGFSLDEAALPCREGCSPLQAVSDGEDYELLFTFPPPALDAIRKKAAEAFPATPVRIIGSMTPSPPSPLPGGWTHFNN